jgi:hypothetical protein
VTVGLKITEEFLRMRPVACDERSKIQSLSSALLGVILSSGSHSRQSA